MFAYPRKQLNTGAAGEAGSGAGDYSGAAADDNTVLDNNGNVISNNGTMSNSTGAQSLNKPVQGSIKRGNNIYPVPTPMPVASATAPTMPSNLNAQSQWAQTAAQLQRARNFGGLNIQ